VSATVVQVLDATADITAYGAGRAATDRVRALDDDLTRLSSRESFALGLGGGIGTVVQGLAVTAALVIAVPAVVAGRIEPVWLAVVALLPLALFEILAGLPASALAYQRLRGSATRLVEVESLASPVVEVPEPVAIPDVFAGLRLQRVSARWVAAEQTSGVPQPDDLAVRDVSVVVDPGERVAIVGPSGSGKSTIAAVIMGFLPYQGSVTLSGVELCEAAGDAVRAHIGMLAQQAHVFDTSIAGNVRIGDPGATDEMVAAALEQAQLGEWVARLPKGDQTVVGSFGVGISGGERQRLALARLLLANRPLVILDEPTEHLDGQTADALAATLDSALRGSTRLLITHRLSGLEDFDRIVELQQGAVVAQGTHGQLLSLEGWYAQQWQLEQERHDMALLLPRLPVGRGVRGPVG
jgi:thiol reductant ABC exporter CydC subunit